MMLQFKPSLYIFFLSVLFFGCQHELNFPLNQVNGTAIFSFDGAPGVCTNTVVKGLYNAGTPLDATNTVTIFVFVSKPGTYSISTGKIDGISFMATGSFTATGQQSVLLVGSGTPSPGVTGNFSFSPGSTACTFSIDVSGTITGTAIFTYDGAPGPCTNISRGGRFTAGTALTSSNRIIIDVNVTKIGSYSVKTALVNGFSFSGTGSFTTLGYAVLSLTGTGTPLKEGVFGFTPSNNGCPFQISVEPATILKDFLKCTIDGVAKTFNFNLSGILIDGTNFSISGFEILAANSPRFDIYFVKFPAITTGTYDQNSAMNQSNYCVAIFNDGVTTTGWSVGQSGQLGVFSAIITSYTANRIEGSFSGTLYSDNGNGLDQKVITDGKFSLPY